MLDINLLREYKNGNPEIVRESQRRRHKDVALVDKVIELDAEWRKLTGEVNGIKNLGNIVSKEVGQRMKAKQPLGDDIEIPQEILATVDKNFTKETLESVFPQLNTNQLKKLSNHITEVHVKQADTDASNKEKERDEVLLQLGNLVHETVVVSDNEDNNGIVRLVGNPRPKVDDSGFKCLKHIDIMRKLGCLATEEGTQVGGGRGYFLMGDLVRLNLALQNYAIQFLTEKGFCPMYTPFFMTKDQMKRVAQLSQFDEELYTVSGEGEDKYLIATSEQPIAAFHLDKRFDESELPLKYCGMSTCFRKEVGAHGKDTLGIFRVHQFEKIEQFVVTSPKDNKSWEMFEDMIGNSEAFYQSLGLSYRVVNIVSGALNNAAAKKLDLEAWFPGAEEGNEYRELVSCSNCTDYQARRLNVRYGKAATKGDAEFCHMLNSTLSATSRTICCIVENYQTPEGVNIPEVLQPYMGGTKFIPYKK
ncbi:seryl-tRNA synthetase [Naegleria gruberi]|uniref:serine--tRNA ligase n=1 Tax=Naegleria gruberi TaxID=5762 RepID=D2VCJ0_NAEGR|nr:seryl-tRNA synthetase [Naegleria gruberi]EFC45319.1 seryl-tRNA synthetase [Naegleria gruberi]|eukprot:XP_002678063.1 seryl-tRNA synthetase [Naegleria gruberi strain NEG-M]